MMLQEVKKKKPLPRSNPERETDRAIKEMKEVWIKAGRPEVGGEFQELCNKFDLNLWKAGLSLPGLNTTSKKKVVVIAGQDIYVYCQDSIAIPITIIIADFLAR